MLNVEELPVAGRRWRSSLGEPVPELFGGGVDYPSVVRGRRRRVSGQHGPLCVLEAKRENRDPYDAKEQGRGYAES